VDAGEVELEDFMLEVSNEMCTIEGVEGWLLKHVVKWED
jgi:hypothetical protein